MILGLTLLSNLLRVPEGVNVERLFAGLPRFLWCRLIQLLCLSDLGLVCAVLETLYTATGMGRFACTRLWGALASADDTVSAREPATVFTPRRASLHLRPLLALLSLEGQAMGPGSLHRVKVVQRLLQPQPQSPHPLFAPMIPPQAPPPPQMVPMSPPHLVVPSPRPTVPLASPQQHQPSITRSPQSLASLLGPPRRSLPLSVVPPQVANVKPEVSSLSELTDRLQMPPPQAPPPRRISARVNGACASPVAASSSAPVVHRSPMVNGRGVLNFLLKPQY